MSLPLDLSSLHRDTSLDTLEKQLICPICLEVFTKPVVILPCQHNLCRKCANELYRVGIGGRFRCPSCRHEVVLDRHGVYGLQRNILVENIIDVYKQESASSRPPPKPLAQLTCEEHEGEKLNIYCITCQLPTCSLCKVFGAHSTCHVAPVPEVYQQQKAELNDELGSLVATNERIQACINDLEEICKNIEENGKNQKQILCEKFDRMSVILEERRNIMVQQITYEQDEKSGWARNLVQTYSEHVETNSKLMQTASNAIEDSEMAAFLQASKSLIEKVREATKCAPTDTLEPGYENMDHYKVDFDAEERALYQLDFLQPEEEVEEIPEEPEPESETELEPEPEMKSEAEPEPVHDPAENPVPDQDLKLEGLEIKTVMSETRENIETQAETKKDIQCDKGGLSTTQDQPELGCKELDAGGLENQDFPVQSDDETKLYPSWYRPNRQMLSSNLPLPVDTLGTTDHAHQQVKELSVQPPFQQSQTPLFMWMSGSFMSMATEKNQSLENHFGRDSMDSPQGHMAEVGKVEKDTSELSDGSASKNRVTSFSLQAITLIFYVLTFLVILQRDELCSVGGQDNRKMEHSTDTHFHSNSDAPLWWGDRDRQTDSWTAPAENSVAGPSSPAVTSESTRLSFSFSWLNPLAKKK